MTTWCKECQDAYKRWKYERELGDKYYQDRQKLADAIVAFLDSKHTTEDIKTLKNRLYSR
jgi:hypothetical protein